MYIIVYPISSHLAIGARSPLAWPPTRTAIWLAEGRIPPGVHPPEAVIDPIPFFKELEEREIYTQVSVTRFL